eukprot:CAMPEP_0172529980 /NCGR_PEP_ID=MMETSP1067-20121228/3884_1 /TAXON_ID=265564 ORGANISM="Thalassiosira punctigera, Strain Tpunct2005C2" /NCGR_SAMPLE_ID=MMETSP1067 /ASSEMBLY_ACC=CAM_ASM_000444 /LENGTH=33 /DNA_ID= /DNA_START= /DNA_END= /DNA_ORIENTATION=
MTQYVPNYVALTPHQNITSKAWYTIINKVNAAL